MDFVTTVVEVTFLPDEFDQVRQLPAPIGIMDDDINEATEQLFVVTLNVLEAANFSLVENTERNISLCRLRDNDRMFTKVSFIKWSAWLHGLA